MLRPFNAEVDGPANSAEAQHYRVVQGERICGWSCDPTGPYYEQDKGLCPAQCLPGYVPPPRKRRTEKIADVCGSTPPPRTGLKMRPRRSSKRRNAMRRRMSEARPSNR